MFKLLLCCMAAFIAVHASGEFVVLHSPESLRFNGNAEVDQSLLKEVMTAALGYTSRTKPSWDGMSISDPFTLPEAVVAVAVEGVDTLDSPKGVMYPLNVDEVEETTWQAIRGRLEERDNDNTIVRINLADGVDALGQSALGELKPTPIDETSLRALTMKNDEDKKFLEEVQLLHAIAKKAPSAIKQDSKSDVYWLVVSGLRPVFDVHGRDSTASKEAVLLLTNALHVIEEAFIQAYDGQVLIVAFTNDSSKVRRTRSFVLGRERRDTKEEEDLNLAKHYNENYPVIFNIMLWFGVIFVFSLLAICIAIADMDPGRDSIIYRMTSNRMKKDN